MPAWVYTFIAVSVTITWVLMNVVASVKGATVDTAVHGVMGIVAGGAFGGQEVARRRDRMERRDADS